MSSFVVADPAKTVLFGGLEVELVPFGAPRFVKGPAAPAIARVHCETIRDSGVNDPGQSRALSWRWEGRNCALATRNVRAELFRKSSGQYAALARLGDTKADLEALLTVLAAAVLAREAGVVLHAAAIEWHDRAVLFIGPSGAGKTTATTHCAGARSFARDRVALVPSTNGYVAWPLPGGSLDGACLPSSNRSWLPLAGIFRVRHGQSMPYFEQLDAARALAVLRESVLSSPGSAADEAELLACLADVVSRTRVAALLSVLGEPLAEVLDAWLAREAP